MAIIMKKSSLIRCMAIVLTGVSVLLAGCGSKVVEYSTWEDGEGTTSTIKKSSGSEGSTITTTTTASVNTNLTDAEGINDNGGSKKKFDLKGETVVWTYYGSEPTPATENYENIMKLRKDIEKKYNCKLEFRATASSMGYYSAWVAAAQSGVKFADIMQNATSNCYRAQFKQGYYAQLDKYLDTSDTCFNQYGRKAMQYNGHDYVVIMSNRWYTPKTLYFNRALFNKFGVETPDVYVDRNEWTFSKFREVAKKLTQKSGGVQYYGCAIDGVTVGNFISYNGGETIRVIDGKYRYEPDAKAIAAVQFCSDLIWNDAVAGPIQNTHDALTSGTVAMALDDSFRAQSTMDAIGADNLGATWGPRGDNVAEHIVSVGETTCFGIPATTDESKREAYAQILRDYNYPYKWRQTLKAQCESCAGDEKSAKTIMEITKKGNQTLKLGPLYTYISRTINWGDYGINSQTSPQAYFDSVKATAQAELDTFWEQK